MVSARQDWKIERQNSDRQVGCGRTATHCVIWDAGDFFLAKHITNNGLRNTNEADQYKASIHHHLLDRLVYLTDQDAITFMLFARSFIL
jgi:hypothetical protein